MARDSAFYQFPIHAIYQGDKALDEISSEQRKDAIQRIVSHTIVTLGEKLQDAERADEDAIRIAERYDVSWFDIDDSRHIGIMVACSKLGLSPGSQSCFFDPSRLIVPRSFGNRFVRVRGDLVWDYHNNEEASWREFCLLCAVYAGIGSKAYSRLSYEQLRTMAMGYNGIAEWQAKHQLKRKDTRLSERQVGYTINALYQRGLFSRVCPNRRHVYYSNKHADDDLAKMIAVREISRKTKGQGKEIRDTSLRQMISQGVAQMASNDSKVDDRDLQDLIRTIEQKRQGTKQERNGKSRLKVV